MPRWVREYWSWWSLPVATMVWALEAGVAACAAGELAEQAAGSAATA